MGVLEYCDCLHWLTPPLQYLERYHDDHDDHNYGDIDKLHHNHVDDDQEWAVGGSWVLVAESEALKGEEGEHNPTSDLSKKIFKKNFMEILKKNQDRLMKIFMEIFKKFFRKLFKKT